MHTNSEFNSYSIRYMSHSTPTRGVGVLTDQGIIISSSKSEQLHGKARGAVGRIGQFSRAFQISDFRGSHQRRSSFVLSGDSMNWNRFAWFSFLWRDDPQK